MAHFRDELSGGSATSLLARTDLEMTASGIAEVIDKTVRVYGLDPKVAMAGLAMLGFTRGVPEDATAGSAAGLLRARHYHRRDCPVSMADCLAAAVAKARSEPLVTGDKPLIKMCRAEGIEVIEIPS